MEIIARKNIKAYCKIMTVMFASLYLPLFVIFIVFYCINIIDTLPFVLIMVMLSSGVLAFIFLIVSQSRRDGVLIAYDGKLLYFSDKKSCLPAEITSVICGRGIFGICSMTVVAAGIRRDYKFVYDVESARERLRELSGGVWH